MAKKAKPKAAKLKTKTAPKKKAPKSRKAPGAKAPKKKRPALKMKRAPKKKPALRAKRVPPRKAKPEAKHPQKAEHRELVVIEKPGPLAVSAPPSIEKKEPPPEVEKKAQPPIVPVPPAPPAQPKIILVAEKKPVSVAPPKPETPPEPTPPVPFDNKAAGGPLAVELSPALDMLPGWEDRLRLRRAIFEDGLKFFSLSRSSPEYTEATSLLAPCGREAKAIQGYFMVCAKDRSGAMIGAMDGYMLPENVLVICRSFAKSDNVRETHILLYSAALSGKAPDYVVFSTALCGISAELAGRLILLGRGFGMSAMPLNHPSSIFFLRRMRNEIDPISSGAELGKVLRALAPLDQSLQNIAAEFEKKGMVPLIPLPASPDNREHLHELRDLVASLNLPSEQLQPVLDSLRTEYVLGRKDITPNALA